jgi:hypothetical protein
MRTQSCRNKACKNRYSIDNLDHNSFAGDPGSSNPFPFDYITNLKTLNPSGPDTGGPHRFTGWLLLESAFSILPIQILIYCSILYFV